MKGFMDTNVKNMRKEKQKSLYSTLLLLLKKTCNTADKVEEVIKKQLPIFQFKLITSSVQPLQDGEIGEHKSGY